MGTHCKVAQLYPRRRQYFSRKVGHEISPNAGRPYCFCNGSSDTILCTLLLLLQLCGLLISILCDFKSNLKCEEDRSHSALRHDPEGTTEHAGPVLFLRSESSGPASIWESYTRHRHQIVSTLGTASLSASYSGLGSPGSATCVSHV